MSVPQINDNCKSRIVNEIIEQIKPLLMEIADGPVIFDIGRLAQETGDVVAQIGRSIVEIKVKHAVHQLLESERDYLKSLNYEYYSSCDPRGILLDRVGYVRLEGAVIKEIKNDATKPKSCDSHDITQEGAGDVRMGDTAPDKDTKVDGTESEAASVKNTQSLEHSAQKEVCTEGTVPDKDTKADGTESGVPCAENTQSEDLPAQKKKKKGNLTRLLNQFYGLTPGTRVHEDAKKRGIALVINNSYRRSAELLGYGLSHMTLWRAINTGEPPEMPIDEAVREIALLEACMDEIHIHTKEGSRELPIGTIAEGRILVGKGRYMLVGKRYFASPIATGPELAESMAAYIHYAYDQHVLHEIRKYGDAANWITAALEEDFPGKVISILDAYHRFKYITRLHNAFRGKRSNVRKSLYVAITKDSVEARIEGRDAFFEELEELSKDDKHTVATLKKCRTYFANNWDAIVTSMTPDLPRSYTEAMVQHMAIRFNAAPATWTVKGANNLLQYKIYLENGGSLKDIDLAPRAGDALEKYRAEIEDYITSIEGTKFDFSVCSDTVATPMDGNSGTLHQISNLRHGGDLQFQ